MTVSIRKFRIFVLVSNRIEYWSNYSIIEYMTLPLHYLYLYVNCSAVSLQCVPGWMGHWSHKVTTRRVHCCRFILVPESWIMFSHSWSSTLSVSKLLLMLDSNIRTPYSTVVYEYYCQALTVICLHLVLMIMSDWTLFSFFLVTWVHCSINCSTISIALIIARQWFLFPTHRLVLWKIVVIYR